MGKPSNLHSAMCHVDRAADKTMDLLNKELKQRHGLSSFDETLINGHVTPTFHGSLRSGWR